KRAIIAHHAIPPKKPVIKLATPCSRDSLSLALSVANSSTTREAVRKGSNTPTLARAIENGKIIAKVSKPKGTLGIKNSGKDLVIVPKSPTVLKSRLVYKAIAVNTIIAISGAGIALKNRDRI